MGTHKLAPGFVLGRYELLMPIAQGGMATVWAARQKGSRGFSKTVAVKTMLPNLSEDETFEQMFLDEASIASKIHHPNVAEILDLGEQDEILYLVMEWVDGESLSALSKQTKKIDSEVPLRVALKIVAQACAGLHAAHELRDDNDTLMQLVHRDISPQNILVAGSGMVKLVDFGVAKALGRSGATSVGQLKGKVPYMSPEQTRGRDLDRRTDLFAMGSVLYRITTGTHPFIDDNDVRTMRNIATRPPIRPKTKNAKIPAELEQVIMKALEKSADRRYQTAAELEADIEKLLILLGGPVSTDEVGLFVRATLAERDQKRRAALRDAARVADEAALAASEAGRLSRPSNPGKSSGETVSDLMLTKTSTPPTFASAVSDVQSDPPPHLSDAPTSALDSAGSLHPSGFAGPEDETRVVVPKSPGLPSLVAAGDASEEEATRAIALASGNLSGGRAKPLPASGKPAADPPAAKEPTARRQMSDPPLTSSPTLAALTGTTEPLPLGRRVAPFALVACLVAAAAIALAFMTGFGGSRRSAAASPSATVPGKPLPAAVEPAETAVSSTSAKTTPGGITLSTDDLPEVILSADPGATATRPLNGRLPTGPSAAPRPSSNPSKPEPAPKPEPPTAPEPPSKPPVAPPVQPPAPPVNPPVTPPSKPWTPAVQDPGF